jgi:fatty acid desaturase
MPSSAARAPLRLFRERAAILPNSLALAGTSAGWLASFWLMGSGSVLVAAAGVLLCAQTMVLAAYLLHEAAHQSLLAGPRANRAAGEWLGFVAGASYASFERIRHMHIRHHVERADIICFNFRRLLARHPRLRHLVELGEWTCLPATEMLMHAQVIVRPFLVHGQRRHLGRVLAMLAVRGMLLAALTAWHGQVLLLYAVAYALFLHVLGLFDGFHHTFELYFADSREPIPRGRSHAYEQANTYSNLISVRWPWLNLLTLNFGYHNAHHERPQTPWYRLPALHRSLYAAQLGGLVPIATHLRAWHAHRVWRVTGQDGTPSRFPGADPAAAGAVGVSFLTVV